MLQDSVNSRKFCTLMVVEAWSRKKLFRYWKMYSSEGQEDGRDKIVPHGTIRPTFEALFIVMEKNWALLAAQCRTAAIAVASVSSHSAEHTSQVSWFRN